MSLTARVPTNPSRSLLAAAGLVVGAAANACDSRSESGIPPHPPGYPYAYAMPDCAPWDGPAVTIYLSPVPADSLQIGAPQVRLSLWRGLGDLVGQTVSWPEEEQVGAGGRCREQGDCQAASAGRVTVRSQGADSTLMGDFELRFSDGSSEAGGFHAVWRSHRMLCG